MDPVKSITSGPVPFPGSKNVQESREGSFMDTLKTFYRNVDDQLKEADRISAEFAVGKRQDIHEIMVASEKANLSFRLLLEIRRKLLESYQEIMRMNF